MTYQIAVAELAATRNSGNLERLRQIIEAYDRQDSSSDLWESSCLLLQACDVLSSHDFGNRKDQEDLIRSYAQRALARSTYASVEQELRLLAHLHHGHEESRPSGSWRENRLTRARRWLRALQVLSDATRDSAISDAPSMKATAPAQDLPSGIAAQHVTEGALRSLYRSTMARNRQSADEFALKWQFRRLRRVYEPLAAKYITSAYAREPHDLDELKQLLNEFLIYEREPSRAPKLIDEKIRTTDQRDLISETAASELALPPRLKESDRDSSRSEKRKPRREPGARRTENRKPEK